MLVMCYTGEGIEDVEEVRDCIVASKRRGGKELARAVVEQLEGESERLGGLAKDNAVVVRVSQSAVFTSREPMCQRWKRRAGTRKLLVEKIKELEVTFSFSCWVDWEWFELGEMWESDSRLECLYS